MPQQINILTSVLLTQKRYFSAYILFQVLILSMLVGGGLYTYWIWEIGAATNDLKQTLSVKFREFESLQVAIKKNGLKGTATGAALTQVQSQRTELLRIEKIIFTLQQGVTQPGYGHAARLELLARTIPSNVWITQLFDEERQLGITGLTHDPALLETWIARLVKTPMFKDQSLQAVKVESVKDGLGTVTLPMWAFSFTVALHRPIVPIESKP